MPQKKINFQDAMHSDLNLHSLVEMVLSGWPEDIYDVPMDLLPYYHTCDVLTSSYMVRLSSSPFRKGQGATVYP